MRPCAETEPTRAGPNHVRQGSDESRPPIMQEPMGPLWCDGLSILQPRRRVRSTAEPNTLWQLRLRCAAHGSFAEVHAAIQPVVSVRYRASGNHIAVSFALTLSVLRGHDWPARMAILAVVPFALTAPSPCRKAQHRTAGSTRPTISPIGAGTWRLSHVGIMANVNSNSVSSPGPAGAPPWLCLFCSLCSLRAPPLALAP